MAIYWLIINCCCGNYSKKGSVQEKKLFGNVSNGWLLFLFFMLCFCTGYIDIWPSYSLSHPWHRSKPLCTVCMELCCLSNMPWMARTSSQTWAKTTFLRGADYLAWTVLRYVDFWIGPNPLWIRIEISSKDWQFFKGSFEPSKTINLGNFSYVLIHLVPA